MFYQRNNVNELIPIHCYNFTFKNLFLSLTINAFNRNNNPCLDLKLFKQKILRNSQALSKSVTTRRLRPHYLWG